MITVNGKTTYLNWVGISSSGGGGGGGNGSSNTEIKNIIINSSEKEMTIIYQNNSTEVVSFKDIKLNNVEIDENDLVTFTNSDGTTLTLDLARFAKESDIVDALNDYYTKTEIDIFLNNKAESNHIHTADEINETTNRKWFTNSDKTKLEGIESNATADMTSTEIKSAYESNSNTNAYDNTAKTKVDRLTLTQPVDLDTLKQEVEANTNKRHNPVTVTQSDDVNVSINEQDLTITVKPQLIGSKALDETLDGSEEVLLNDNGILKKTTVQTIVDMVDNDDVDVSGKEDKSNKVTTIRDDSSATDINYPSEKAVRVELDSMTSKVDNHKNQTDNPHNVTKEQVGLDKADNTSDLDKPISTDTQNALNNKEDKTNKKTSIAPTSSASDSKYVSEKAIRTALDGKANNSHSHTADDVTETNDKKWFTPTERVKLSNIEENATGDMTSSEIKQAYESNNDTNAYTNDDKTTVSHLTITNDIDLDDLKQEVTLNSNKRHEPVTVSDTDDIDMQISDQEVSGTIRPTAIANKDAKVELDNTDEFLINDGGVLKKTTVEAIINKVPSIDNSGKEDKNNKTTTIRDSDNADDVKYPTERAVRVELDSQSDYLDSHKNDTNNPHNVTKAHVGLENADNTSDADKPISTATQTALDNKEDKSNKGQADGYASLDANGKVPNSQLPSYVDDVVEYATRNSFPTVGESSKIYISKDDNKTWRWGGSDYINLGSGNGGLALGETSSTAYRGDRGKIAYDHSQLTSGNPHNVSKSDVGLGNVDNTADLDKPISTAVQQALDNKPDSNHTHNLSDISIDTDKNWNKKRITNIRSVGVVSNSNSDVKTDIVNNEIYLKSTTGYMLINMYDTSNNAEFSLVDTSSGSPATIGSKLKFTPTTTYLGDKKIVTYQGNKFYTNPDTEIEIDNTVYAKPYVLFNCYAYAAYIGDSSKWGELKVNAYTFALPTKDTNSVFNNSVGTLNHVSYGGCSHLQEDVESITSDGSGGYLTYNTYSFTVPESDLYEVTIKADLSVKSDDFDDWLAIGLLDSKPDHTTTASLTQRVAVFKRDSTKTDSSSIHFCINNSKIFLLDSTKSYYPCMQSLTGAYLHGWQLIVRRIRK